MQPARLSPTPALAAACAGVAAWCSLGSLTVTEAGAYPSRIGLLPPVSWLIALVGGAVALAWAWRLSADRARPLFFGAFLVMPWLPLRLPGAVLAWTGPVSWFVWAAIGCAVLTAGEVRLDRWPRWRAALTHPARAPWIAFTCAALVYGAASYRLAPLVPGGDEPHYLVIAQSLWRDGDLRVENNHLRGDYLEYFGGALRPDYLKRGQDGQIYSIHLPGVPALIAPVLAAGGYGLVKTVLALVSAGATAVAWRTAFLLTGSAAAAWFGWAAVGMSAPFLLISFTVYPDGPGAVVVLLAFAAIVRLHARPKRPASWWLAVGVLPALLPWFHPRFAVLAGALGLVFAGRAVRESRAAVMLMSFAAFPALGAIGWFGYYYAIYGRFDPSVAYGHYTQMSIGGIPTGVLGLLFDQQYGLIVNAPVFAIGLAGLVPLFQRHRRVAIEWLVVVVPYALVTAMYHMWWGGFSSPARFIGATFLLFALPAAMAWMTAREAVTRSLQGIALGISVAVAAMLVAVEGGQFAFNIRDTVAPWLVWFGQIADVAHGVPSLFRLQPAPALVQVAVWVAAACTAWIVARVIGNARRLRPGAAALVLLCAMGLAITTSLAIVWRFEGVSGVVATTGQLRSLEAAGHEGAAHGVVFEPFTITSPWRALERVRIGLEPVAGAPPWAWLWVPRLPAGRYRLWIDTRTAVASFDASVVVGRSDGPLDEWRFEHLAPGAVSRDVALPVDVRAMAVRGADNARSMVRALWLQPVGNAGRAPRLSEQRATAARRYGRVAIFALGNAVYLEPGGLWTAAGSTAEIVVTPGPDQDGFGFVLRAGAVATPVEITSGALSIRLSLAAGESRDLVIPLRPGEPALVRVRAEHGFRPASVDPASTDVRMLGVRLEPSVARRN
jgi:hypothetical protein